MTPIAASTVQAMAGIFHPFVSLCFQCIFVPGHIVSHLNALEQYLLQSRAKDSCKAATREDGAVPGNQVNILELEHGGGLGWQRQCNRTWRCRWEPRVKFFLG